MGELPVQILHFDAATLDALAAGDLELANTQLELALPPAFAEPDWQRLWRMRSDQVRTDPASVAWVTGAIVCAGTPAYVGRAGFHGPPDDRGMVEVGYTVLPEHRRLGYARAALRVLLQRAADEPGVRVVRATISPDNLASRHLVASFGFLETGEQWDEEDGLETIFEVDPTALVR